MIRFYYSKKNIEICILIMSSKNSERTQITFEFPIKCSRSILFEYISTPSGLASWFSENVVTKSNKQLEFIFEDGEKIEATILKITPNTSIRFHLADSLPEEFLELEIDEDELTSDLVLRVTEFCNPNQVSEYQELWDSEFEQLKTVLGVS